MSNTRPFPKTMARVRREQFGVQLRVEPYDARAVDAKVREADITLANRWVWRHVDGSDTWYAWREGSGEDTSLHDIHAAIAYALGGKNP